jgi:membrane-associated protease RseP (regulator of RpoE activity)
MTKLYALIVVSVVCTGATAAEAQSNLERLEDLIRRQTAEKALPQAAAPAATQAGYVGITADDRLDRGQGVRIIKVRQQSPAAQAGLREQDLIVGVNDTPVNRMEDLAPLLAAAQPGQVLIFEVLRGAARERIGVTVGAPQRPPVLAPPANEPMPAADTPPPPVAEPPQPAAVPQDVVAELLRRVEELEQRVARLEEALRSEPPPGPAQQ